MLTMTSAVIFIYSNGREVERRARRRILQSLTDLMRGECVPFLPTSGKLSPHPAKPHQSYAREYVRDAQCPSKVACASHPWGLADFMGPSTHYPAESMNITNLPALRVK